MTQYVLTYFSEPTFQTAEEGGAYRARWMEWIGALGEAVVTPAKPLRRSVSVDAEGSEDVSSAERVTGFTIVQADSLEAAVEMAATCPHLDHGRIEVGEEMAMGPG